MDTLDVTLETNDFDLRGGLAILLRSSRRGDRKMDARMIKSADESRGLCVDHIIWLREPTPLEYAFIIESTRYIWFPDTV